MLIRREELQFLLDWGGSFVINYSQGLTGSNKHAQLCSRMFLVLLLQVFLVLCTSTLLLLSTERHTGISNYNGYESLRLVEIILKTGNNLISVTITDLHLKSNSLYLLAA